MDSVPEVKKRQFNGIVYPAFSSVPKDLIVNGFIAKRTIEAFVSKCQWYRERVFQEEVTAKLTTMINLLSWKGEVSVLDYGGGIGQFYFSVAKHLISPQRVVWNVFDVEEMIKIANEKIKRPFQMFFFDDIDAIKKADIVFFRQTLQILEKPHMVLEKLVDSFRPAVILMSGIPAGQNEDYLTLVISDGEKGLPCWIFNEENLVHSVEAFGYVLRDRFVENITVDLSEFRDLKFHLDRERKNHVKGYIFLRGDIDIQR